MEPVPQSETVAAPVAAKAVWPTSYSILAQALAFYKKHAKAFFMIGLIPSGLTIIIAALLPVLDGASPLAAVAALVTIILSIAAGVVGIVNQIAVIKSVDSLDKNEAVNVKAVYKLGFALFFPMLWVSILSGLVTSGGLVALIVPGIILGIYVVFALYVMVLEGKRGMASLVQSMAYAKGQAMEVFKKSVYFGLASIVLYVFILAILAVASLIATNDMTTIFTIISDRAPLTFGKVVYTTVSDILAYTVFLPIYFTYGYFMYKQARAAKESNPATDAEKAKYGKTLVIWSIVGIVAVVALVAVMAMSVLALR
ncbi:MAG TPA: hypothetical protein VGE35_03610 [Candidatus Paceibacterota bacterium]